MQAIRSKGTKPERLVFAALKARKIYFAAHVDTLPGKPDIIFRRKKVAVFIDSDFWHGNPERFIPPKSNIDYWEAKIARNRARDLAVTAELSAKGWTILRFWEWDILHGFDAQFSQLLSAIGRGSSEV
jgi:DNA mismatch endonuclease (patch repair protein)